MKRHSITIDWKTSMGLFAASASWADMTPDYGFSCCEEAYFHTAMKLFVDEIQVGDPIFDSRVYIRTSDRERTAASLAREGVQSAILVFVIGMRNDRFIFSHVTLDNQLTARAIPMHGLTDELTLEYRQNFAALAFHLSM